MAISAKLMTNVNVANWIPTIWSKQVLAAVEHSLVTGALVDRSYEQYARAGGSRIVVPNLANLTAAAVNTDQDLTLYGATQGATNIDVNYFFDVGVGLSDIEDLQINPDYMEKVKGKVAYSLAQVIDWNTNALFAGFDTAVGTTGSALTEDDLIEAYENLNEADAPFTDRAWVFDPESITDLLKQDYFIRMDYVPGSVVSQGFQGRQIFGSPVYISTNLTVYGSTNEHMSGYFQREAIALVMQMQPKFEVARLPLQHSDAIIGLCAYGLMEMRGTFGVLINCRS